jgi:hypothetical protein
MLYFSKLRIISISLICLFFIFITSSNFLGTNNNFFNKKNKISSFEIGKIRLGEQSLLYKEYTGYSDYSGGTFPSGLVKNINYFKIKIDCKFNDKFRIFLNIDNENFF